MLVCRNSFNRKVRNWRCGSNSGAGSVLFESAIAPNLTLLIVSILPCRITLFVGVLHSIFIFTFPPKKNESGFPLNIFGLIVTSYSSGMTSFGKRKSTDTGGGVDDGDDVLNDVTRSLVVHVGHVAGA